MITIFVQTSVPFLNCTQTHCQTQSDLRQKKGKSAKTFITISHLITIIQNRPKKNYKFLKLTALIKHFIFSLFKLQTIKDTKISHGADVVFIRL